MTTSIDVPKPVSQLPSLTTPNGNTQVIASHTANSVTNTYLISLKSVLAAAPGPYANDAIAANSSVAVGQMYYDTTGIVRIRLS
jgi:hypothetical protein